MTPENSVYMAMTVKRVDGQATVELKFPLLETYKAAPATVESDKVTLLIQGMTAELARYGQGVIQAIDGALEDIALGS